jgi:hypothetical protein
MEVGSGTGMPAEAEKLLVPPIEFAVKFQIPGVLSNPVILAIPLPYRLIVVEFWVKIFRLVMSNSYTVDPIVMSHNVGVPLKGLNVKPGIRTVDPLVIALKLKVPAPDGFTWASVGKVNAVALLKSTLFAEYPPSNDNPPVIGIATALNAMRPINAATKLQTINNFFITFTSFFKCVSYLIADIKIPFLMTRCKSNANVTASYFN